MVDIIKGKKDQEIFDVGNEVMSFLKGCATKDGILDSTRLDRYSLSLFLRKCKKVSINSKFSSIELETVGKSGAINNLMLKKVDGILKADLFSSRQMDDGSQNGTTFNLNNVDVISVSSTFTEKDSTQGSIVSFFILEGLSNGLNCTIRMYPNGHLNVTTLSGQLAYDSI